MPTKNFQNHSRKVGICVGLLLEGDAGKKDPDIVSIYGNWMAPCLLYDFDSDDIY